MRRTYIWGANMSAELTKARQQLTQIRVYLKQDKPVPAAQALQFALGTMLRQSLIKSEREEFERLLTEGVDYLGNHEVVREHFPRGLAYAPGFERELYEAMKDVINTLSKLALDEAQELFRQREVKKQAWFDRGAEELESQPSKGQSTLAALIREFPDDAMLRARVGEVLLNAKLYETAVDYLTEALDMRPDMVPFYNMIGMALRKLERFEVAESYYLRASQYLRHDPNLYFNIGRLYVDWGKWPRARKAAEMALKLSPEFVEAQKLLRYVESKLAK